MWKYKSKQKVFEIGEVKVGGLLGEAPRVLIGSIFYGKHKIVTDERTGQFDHVIAEEIIKRQEEFSDKTGNPCMIDVVGTTYEALIKFLDFTSGISSSPLVMDGITPDVRINALKYVDESGLSDRIIYKRFLINP